MRFTQTQFRTFWEILKFKYFQIGTMRHLWKVDFSKLTLKSAKIFDYCYRRKMSCFQTLVELLHWIVLHISYKQNCNLVDFISKKSDQLNHFFRGFRWSKINFSRNLIFGHFSCLVRYILFKKMCDFFFEKIKF